jgi:hypothetical protein
VRLGRPQSGRPAVLASSGAGRARLPFIRRGGVCRIGRNTRGGTTYRYPITTCRYLITTCRYLLPTYRWFRRASETDWAFRPVGRSTGDNRPSRPPQALDRLNRRSGWMKGAARSRAAGPWSSPQATIRRPGSAERPANILRSDRERAGAFWTFFTSSSLDPLPVVSSQDERAGPFEEKTSPYSAVSENQLTTHRIKRRKHRFHDENPTQELITDDR